MEYLLISGKNSNIYLLQLKTSIYKNTFSCIDKEKPRVIKNTDCLKESTK